jgi:hypothetical protein
MRSVNANCCFCDTLVLSTINFANCSPLKESELDAIKELHIALVKEVNAKQLPDNVKKNGAWMHDSRLITTMGLFVGSETLFAIGFNLSSIENQFIIKHLKKVGGHKLFGRGMMATGILGMAGSVTFIMINDLMFPDSVAAATLTEYYMSKDGFPDFLTLVLNDPESVEFYMETDPCFSSFVVDFNSIFIKSL